MTDTITEFVKTFCGSSESDGTAEVLQTNYKACFRLANQWEELIQIHYMECEAPCDEIWDRDTALKATEIVSRLYTAGNEALRSYQQTTEAERAGKPAIGKPTLEQCIGIIKKYRSVQYPDGGWPKINAIKDLRTLTGCGLREAKDFLEAVDEQLKLKEANTKS